MFKNNPELLEWFQQSIFKGQVEGGRPRVCDQLCPILCLVDGDQSFGTGRSRGYVLMIVK